jgi:hypothetical protein
MKREKIIGILLLIFMIFPLASAFLIEGDSPKFEMPGTIDANVSQVSPNLFSALADGGLNVDVIWPLPGYYYVTDYLKIEAHTNNIANCTFDFQSSVHGMYENGTDHWDYLYNLADNMEGDPYEISFECTDSLSTEYNDTWFWINTSDLDRYLLRGNIGSHEYVGAELLWEGKDEGLLQVYSAGYLLTIKYCLKQRAIIRLLL